MRFEDQLRFAATRIALRELLGASLSIPSAELHFEYGRYGKPVLNDNAMNFNVSHSGDYALIALSREHRVGIDIERASKESVVSFAHVALSAEEWLYCNKGRNTPLFYQLWTAKEAVLKALGLGIGEHLKSLSVTPQPDYRHQLKSEHICLDKVEAWRLESPGGYAAALAKAPFAEGVSG